LIATGSGRPSHKHDAGTEEFAGLGELGGNALGMQDGCILIGVFASDPIGRETVFVDDVEEEAHAARLSRTTVGFQVTKL
jgi:hypothetical protein